MVAKKAVQKGRVKRTPRKNTRKKAKGAPEVQVYKVSSHNENTKKASQGYIKHSLIALAAAAITGFIIGKLFFWRKKE